MSYLTGFSPILYLIICSFLGIALYDLFRVLIALVIRVLLSIKSK